MVAERLAFFIPFLCRERDEMAAKLGQRVMFEGRHGEITEITDGCLRIVLDEGGAVKVDQYRFMRGMPCEAEVEIAEEAEGPEANAPDSSEEAPRNDVSDEAAPVGEAEVKTEDAQDPEVTE